MSRPVSKSHQICCFEQAVKGQCGAHLNKWCVNVAWLDAVDPNPVLHRVRELELNHD